MMNPVALQRFQRKVSKVKDIQKLKTLLDIVSDWAKDAQGLLLSKQTYFEICRVIRAQIKRLERKCG